MITLQAQFTLLREARKFVDATKCEAHDWSDVHADQRKRLRAGEVQCTRCKVIVPIQSAFFYEAGKRHGAERALADARAAERR